MTFKDNRIKNGIPAGTLVKTWLVGRDEADENKMNKKIADSIKCEFPDSD